jgi:glyceraldehyde 3-phosphate dehydrogenase
VDLPLTEVLGDSLISLATWYDNEMGYATRLAEVAITLAGQ